MIKYLAFFLFSATSVLASDLHDSLEDQKNLGLYNRETCHHLASRAGAVMMARQFGKRPSTVIAGASPDDQSFVEALVFLAYDYPRYSSEEMMSRAIDDFENMVEIECFKVFYPK